MAAAASKAEVELSSTTVSSSTKKNHFNSTINNDSGIGGTNILLLQSEIAEWRKRRRQRTREGGDWLEKWKRIGVEKSEDEKASSTSISKRERIP